MITVCKGLEECVLLILTRGPPSACPCLSAQPPIISHWQTKPRPPPPIFRFPQPPTKSDFLPRWNSDLSGGRNLDFSGRNFGFAATSWGRLIRQQSVRRKPRGARERGRNQLDSSWAETIPRLIFGQGTKLKNFTENNFTSCFIDNDLKTLIR